MLSLAPFERNLFYVLLTALAFLALGLFVLTAAAQTAPPPTPAPPKAGECPTPQPCRVLTLTAEEQNALLGPNMILDTAQQGRPLDLAGAVQYFRSKVQNAPAGIAPAEKK